MCRESNCFSNIFQSDNQDNEKITFDIDNQNNDNGTREYVSSPGYDTSSTHPPSSPDLCEYTYEGAIQDYKSRVSRAQKSGFTNQCFPDVYPKESNGQAPRKQTSAEIENRLSNFEWRASNDGEKNENLMKDDLPKVDIARRRELFEKDKITPDKKLDTEKMINNLVGDFSQAMSIKERLINLESRNDSLELSGPKTDSLNSEFGSVKDRLVDIENGAIIQHVQHEKHVSIDVPITSLKDRLSTLQEVIHTNTDKTVQPDYLVTSTEVTSSSDQTMIEVTKTTNENISNNNHAVETMEEILAEMEDHQETVEMQANNTFVDQPQPPVPDVVQEQPNRLLSTINEAIQLEDQTEDIVKRDASVSSPNLFVNHVLDDIVVDNDVIDDVDDTSKTNPKSYLVMDDSTSDNIVHTSRTDDTAGNEEVLTCAGESLCTSSNATFSDCRRRQSINDEPSNKNDETYLRCLDANVSESEPNVSHVETVKQVESVEPITVVATAVDPVEDVVVVEPVNGVVVVEPVKADMPISTIARTAEIKLNFIELRPFEDNDQNSSPVSNEVLITTSAVHSENHSSIETVLQNSIIKTETLTTATDSTSSDLSVNPSIAKESTESKNNRIKCQIVGVLEKHKCPSDTPAISRSDLTINTGLAIDTNHTPSQSPSKSPLSPYKSPKGIFDFIKRNLLNDPLPVAKDAVQSNGNDVHSTFYVPLMAGNNGSAQQPLNFFCEGGADESTEINNLIDEELEKLG